MWPRTLDYTVPECVGIFRGLELKAYSGVLDALRAGGSLTPQKSNLLADLRKTLNISEDRHKAEVRRSINSEILNTVCEKLSGPDELDQWRLEGRRIIPLLPRSAPITGYTAIAAKAKADIVSLNKELPPPWDTRSVFPLPPLQREIKSPEPEDPVFVKPEPVSTADSSSQQSLNGSVGGFSSPDKIKTEIKEEILEEETGMVFLPSGMAVKISNKDKPSSPATNERGGRKGGAGKRKRSVSRSIEVFPKGVPLVSSPSAVVAGSGPALSTPSGHSKQHSTSNLTTPVSGGKRRASISSPPRKFNSPLSPVHQAGHGYARPPPPSSINNGTNTNTSRINSASADHFPIPQQQLNFLDSPLAAAVAAAHQQQQQQQQQQSIALDLAQHSAGSHLVQHTPGTGGKRGPGRPPGAPSPATRGGVAGVRTRGARAPRARGSRSRGRGANALTSASSQPPPSGLSTPIQQQRSSTTAPGIQQQQYIYTPQQQQQQQTPSGAGSRQQQTIQQQLISPPQQQQQHLQQQQASIYTSLGPVLTSMKSNTAQQQPRVSAVYPKDGLHQFINTNSTNSSNAVSYAQYISTTPTKVLNLARSNTSGAILTPVTSTAVVQAVRALTGGGGKAGGGAHYLTQQQQNCVVKQQPQQYQQLTPQKQVQVLSHQQQHKVQLGPAPSEPDPSEQQQPTNLSTTYHYQQQPANLSSSCQQQPVNLSSTSQHSQTPLDLNGKNEVGASSNVVNNCQGTVLVQGINTGGFITDANNKVSLHSSIGSGSSTNVHSFSIARPTMGLSASNTVSGTGQGIKLIANAKIVPKSVHGGGGPVYIVKNSNQRVLNSRLVTVPGGASGGPTFVTTNPTGATFVAGGAAGATISNSLQRQNATMVPTVIRNIRTSSAPGGKSVIVVKPGGGSITGAALRGTLSGASLARPVSMAGSGGATPIIVRGSTAGFIRTPVSIAGTCRVTQRPVSSSTTPMATFVRQHSNGNNGSVVVSSTTPSGANMYLLDVSSGAGLSNSQNIITTTSAITLNNLDPIVQHRITAGKPVLASKQVISVSSGNSGALATPSKAVPSANKIFITNPIDSFSTSSSSSGSGNTLKSPSFWLQPKAVVSSHSSDNILQQQQLQQIQHVQVNNPPPPLVGKLVSTSTAVGSGNSQQQVTKQQHSINQHQPINQQQQNVSIVNNSYMEEDNAGNNYSDIFSRAMEQANIPSDILPPPAADNSPLPPQTLIQPPLDLVEQTTITPKQLLADMIAISSNAGGVVSVALTSTVAGGRSVTLQSRNNVSVDSTAVAGGISTATSNLVPNSFSSTGSNIPLSIGNNTITSGIYSGNNIITSGNNSGNSNVINSGSGIVLQSPATTSIALTSGSATNSSSGTVLPHLVEALDTIPDILLQPAAEGSSSVHSNGANFESTSP